MGCNMLSSLIPKTHSPLPSCPVLVINVAASPSTCLPCPTHHHHSKRVSEATGWAIGPTNVSRILCLEKSPTWGQKPMTNKYWWNVTRHQVRGLWEDASKIPQTVILQKGWVRETKITPVSTNWYNKKQYLITCHITNPAMSSVPDHIHLRVLIACKTLVDCRFVPQKLLDILQSQSGEVKTSKKCNKPNFDQRTRRWLNNLSYFFSSNYKHASSNCTSLYCALQMLHFLQIEGKTLHQQITIHFIVILVLLLWSRIEPTIALRCVYNIALCQL